jgi:hypothetical protein
VKQRCESKQFIAINDKVEMNASFLYQMEDERKRARQRRERERERERVLLEERDSVGNKIDS